MIIVVVIIGILAAIAIPRLSRAAEDAAPTATKQDWAVLQKQIDLYAADHGGVYPAAAGDGTNAAHTEAAFIAQMLTYSDADGVTSSTRSSQFPYGPYLAKGIPKLKSGLKAGFSALKMLTGATTPGATTEDVGWVYNDTTGDIVPNDADLVAMGGLSGQGGVVGLGGGAVEE